MRSGARRVWFVGVLGAVALVAAACGDGDGSSLAEQAVEEGAERSGTDVDVDIDEESGEFSVRGEDGEGSFSVGGSGELPESFPDGFPLPDDVRIGSSFSSEQEGRSGFSVTAEASGSYDEIVSFYEEALPSSGYEIESTNTASGGGTDSTTLGIAGDEHQGAVTVTASEEATVISIVLEGTG